MSSMERECPYNTRYNLRYLSHSFSLTWGLDDHPEEAYARLIT